MNFVLQLCSYSRSLPRYLEARRSIEIFLLLYPNLVLQFRLSLPLLTMLHFSTCVLVLLACSISGLPLNINLGAYSPALVVGDGEISFGGNQDVSNLMNALEGAAVQGAAANAGTQATSIASAAATQATTTENQVTDQEK